jgi:hypothetical protein
MSGSTIKQVTCSYCGCQFVYRMKREANGEATSWLWLDNNGASAKSSEKANENLYSKLQDEIDTISCPDCGKYQDDMAKKLYREAWSKVLRVAISFGVIGIIVICIGSWISSYLPNWLQTSLLLAIIGFWIWAVLKMAIQAYNFDANANAQERKGRSTSVNGSVLRLSEFEALLQKRDR